MITQILSFEENRPSLLTSMSKTVDWEKIVKIASAYRLLPALFTRLEQKNLMDLVPKDLVEYLEEITRLNMERNHTLELEARAISDILEARKIDFVFIKGVALLAKGLFDENHERMIGDIDLLVRPEQCREAFQILSEQGYNKTVEFNYDTEDFRHLPRQINTQKLAAVEIHTQVLNKNKFDLLPTHAILKAKQWYHGISIPSDNHSLEIAIYSSQVNNHAYYLNTLDLKTVFDVLALMNCYGMDIIHRMDNNKFTEKFFILFSELLPELRKYPGKRKKPFYRTLFILSNTYPKFGFIMFKAKNFLLAIYKRLNLFIFNKSYRKHVMTNKLQLIVILANLFFLFN